MATKKRRTRLTTGAIQKTLNIEKSPDDLINFIAMFDSRNQTISDFRYIIKHVVSTVESGDGDYKNAHLSQGSTIRDCFVSVCGNGEVSLASVKGKPLKHLKKVLQSGRLPLELNLPAANVTVINCIAQKYCMVSVRQEDKSNCVWSTLAYCLDGRYTSRFTGSGLFFSAFKSFLQNHIKCDKELLQFLKIDYPDFDLIILSHFANLLHFDLFVYRHMSAQDCVQLNEEFANKGIQIQDDDHMPGSVEVELFKCDANETIYTPMLFGCINNFIYPFIVHSNEAQCDISALMTRRSTLSDVHVLLQAFCDTGKNKLSSAKILQQHFPIRHTDFKHFEQENVAGRNVIMPHCIEVEFEEMNASKLGRAHSKLLNRFGALVFRTKDFSSVQPIIKMPSQSDKMDFDIQSVQKIPGVDGIFVVLTEGSIRLTSEEAESQSHHLFEKMSSNDPLKGFLVFTNPEKIAGRRKSAKPFATDNESRKYLYAKGETVPFIFDWTRNAERLLNKNTSTLQQVNKYYEIEGVTSYQYYVSLGNSTFRVQVGNRGLNACSYLLVGIKFWVVVPKRHYPRFLMWLEMQLKDKAGVDFTTCPNWLQHKILFIDIAKVPAEFEVTFIVQKAGDLVLLDNYAIHWGWNVTFNVAMNFNWTNNPHWDKVQHFMPLCNMQDDNCSPPVLSMENLKLIRETDGLISDSSIPVTHISDPKFSYFASQYKPPYQANKVATLGDSITAFSGPEDFSCATPESILREEMDYNNTECHANNTQTPVLTEVNGKSNLESVSHNETQSRKSHKRTSNMRHSSTCDTDSESSSTNKERRRKKKRRKQSKKKHRASHTDSDSTDDDEYQRKKNKKKKKRFSSSSDSSSDYSSDETIEQMLKDKRVSVKCKYCDTLIHSEGALRNHYCYTLECKAKKLSEKLSVSKFWKAQKAILWRQVVKEKKARRKERRRLRKEKRNNNS